MNINKIKEMPSKEVCRISTTMRSNNMSPISAMMITKPPEITGSRKTSVSLNRQENTSTQRKSQNKTELKNHSYSRRNNSNSNLKTGIKLFMGLGDERYN